MKKQRCQLMKMLKKSMMKQNRPSTKHNKPLGQVRKMKKAHHQKIHHTFSWSQQRIHQKMKAHPQKEKLQMKQAQRKRGRQGCTKSRFPNKDIPDAVRESKADAGNDPWKQHQRSGDGSRKA